MKTKSVEQKKKTASAAHTKTTNPRNKSSDRKSSTESFSRATLDALTSHICVLDKNGVILFVNRAWQDFARANFGDRVQVSQGANYLAVCDSAKGDDAEIAASVAAAIRTIISGERQSFSIEYPCHSPNEKRWFIARVTKWQGKGEACVVVAHENITAQKQTEEKLQTAQESYRALYENISDMIIVVNTEGIIKFANPAAKNILGYEPSQAIGTNFVNFCHPDDQANVVHAFEYRIQHPEDPPGILEVRVHHKDGSWRALEAIGNNLFEHPTIEGIVITARDITERKRAEEALRKNEEKYRLLFENMAQGAFFHSTDGTLLDCNQAALNMLGLTREQFLSRTAFDPRWQCIREDSSVSPIEERPATIALKTGQAVRDVVMGVYNPRMDDYVWLIVHTIPMFKSGEKMPYQVLVTMHDITERKRAEEALRESQQRFAIIFEHSPIAIGISRLSDNQFVDVNLALLDLFGCSRDELIGHTPFELGIWIDPEEHRRLLEMLKTRTHVLNFVTLIRHKSGKLFDISIAAQIIEINHEKSLLTQITNITERKRAEEEREQLIRQLQSSREQLKSLSQRLVEVQEQERRELARELHDEIGQWLTGLKLILHMSADMPKEKIMSNIEQAQATLAELIVRVRDLSLNLRPVMLDDLGLLPTLVWFFERYTDQTQVKIVFQHTGLEGRRLGSVIETGTFRIIQEGLTNIARHAQVDQATVRIWVDLNTLNLQIEDQGKGFDPPSIFATSKTSGLTGMRERAVLLGGNLTIDSAPNGGTRLTAEIPLQGRIEKRNHAR